MRVDVRRLEGERRAEARLRVAGPQPAIERQAERELRVGERGVERQGPRQRQLCLPVCRYRVVTKMSLEPSPPSAGGRFEPK